MEKIPIIILVLINLPLFGVMASLLFGKKGLTGAIKYLFIPEIISALKGEFWDDKWAELMFTIWIALCAAMIWWEYNLIKEHFPSLLLYFSTQSTG